MGYLSVLILSKLKAIDLSFLKPEIKRKQRNNFLNLIIIEGTIKFSKSL